MLTVAISPKRRDISAHRVGRLRRDLIVCRALDQKLGHVEGQQISRVAGLITVRQLLRTAAHQGVDLMLVVRIGEISRQIDGQSQIDCARKGNRPQQRNLRPRLIDLAVGLDVMPARNPEREMAAGRMAHA